MRFVLVSEPTAVRRRVEFHLVDATDGMTPELSEAAGQPQISTNGAAWTNTGIGTLTAIGNGRYYADLTAGAVAAVGDIILTRYKSANTAECPADSFQVVSFDPSGGLVGSGWTEIASGTLTNQDLSAAFVTVATLTAPTSGSCQYKIVIKLTDLATSHQLQAEYVQGSFTSIEPGYIYNGTTANTVTLTYEMTAADTSIVVKLKDVVAGSTAVDGTYDVYKDAGGVSAAEDAIAAAVVAAMGNLSNPVIVSPVGNSTLDIVQGDEYEHDEGRGLLITETSSETIWPTTLSEVHFYAVPTAQTLVDTPAAASLTAVACTVVTASGDGQAFRLELTDTQTETLAVGHNAYNFAFVANKSTNPATVRVGTMTVRDNLRT